MDTQNTATAEGYERFIVLAGGRPWVVVAVLRTRQVVECFLARHRSIHPSCPLKVSTGIFHRPVHYADWTFLD